MSDQNINVNVNVYDQSGNFGAGHVSESKIDGTAKLGGIINEGEKERKTTSQEKNQKISTNQVEEKTRLFTITISGEFDEINLSDILQIQSEILLKLKDISKLKNSSINLVDADKGSIKLTFEVSEEELELLKTLIQSGELTKVSGRTIENIKVIDSEREERELRNKLNSRNNLIKEIKSHKIEKRNLEKVNLKLSNLRGMFLEQADLRGADLRGADLSGAHLRGADLSGANLSDTDLRGADLSGANLRGAFVTSETRLQETKLDAEVSQAIIRGMGFLHSILLRQVQLTRVQTLPKLTLPVEIIITGDVKPKPKASTRSRYKLDPALDEDAFI